MENNDKKNREELKNKLHGLIDGIEDEHILNMLNKDVIAYMVSKVDEDEDADDEEDEIEKDTDDE